MSRRLSWLLLPAAALALAACSGDDAAGPQTREVLVDYNHDEFAGSFLLYFPRDVMVRPGDTVRFRQEWTGEPHSVTMGRLVDEVMAEAMPIVERYRGTPEEEIPRDDFEKVDGLFSQLPPFMLGDSPEDNVNQNVGQPCYLDEGGPPEDPDTPCTDEQQIQPAFNGRQSFYNSGFIPYEGPQGNVFDVPLAEDIAPGTYYYYCNVHGPLQYGTINVVEPGTPIPSQAEVSRKAREEIEAAAAPLIEALEQARAESEAEIYGVTVRKPYSGWGVDDLWTHAFVSEFIPADLEVEVGEKVTWSFVGPHTVSFDVPEYFAEITVADDGTVAFSPEAVLPVGGPGYPAPDEGEGGGEGGDGPPEPAAVDAGEWDGDGFISSGLFFDGTYSLTFTRAGTYKYACLVHPRMVGTVVVR